MVSVVMGCGGPCCSATSVGWKPGARRAPPEPPAPRARSASPAPPPHHTPDCNTADTPLHTRLHPIKETTLSYGCCM